MLRRFSVVSLLVLASALPATAARRRAVSIPLDPPCGVIVGTSAVGISRDGGQTLMINAESPQPISYTYGLVAMNSQTIAAFNKNDVLISNDRGCSWHVAATIEGSDFPPSLLASRDNSILYVWSENRVFFARIDDRGVRTMKQPVAFLGVGVDPNNAEHLRAGGSDGSLWDSPDGGETWNPLGRLGTDAPLYYRFTFDPKDLDHIVAGTVNNGAFVTRDGGRNWTKATGLAKNNANVFQLVISPVDSNRVWAMGIDLTESNDNVPSHGRHIYMSSDGGATYTPVIDEAPGVKLINGPVMAAHPTNRDVLYFVFGTYVFQYGTDLFRYDASTQNLTLMHHDGVDNFNAIAFAPDDPQIMYLGLEAID